MFQQQGVFYCHILLPTRNGWFDEYMIKTFLINSPIFNMENKTSETWKITSILRTDFERFAHLLVAQNRSLIVAFFSWHPLDTNLR